jgi:hypothetical protein
MEQREKHLQEEGQHEGEGERHIQEEEQQEHNTGQENLGVLAGVTYSSSEISNPPVPSYKAVIEGGDSYPVIESSYPGDTAISSASDSMDAVTAGVGGMSLHTGYTPLSSFSASPAYGYESFPPTTLNQAQPLVDRSTKPADTYSELQQPEVDQAYSGLQRPDVDRSSKPVASVTQLSSMSDVGDLDTSSTIDGLRRVIVSEKLIDDFLQAALPNTLRNTETCGILCGKLVSYSLQLHALVLSVVTM